MTDEEIQQSLYSEKLDIRMDVEPESPEHQWFRLALDEGRQLCVRSGLPLTFTFNCSPDIQAYALYRYNVVAISAGCFDFICRIADRIITKGIFQAVGTPPAPAWTPSSKNTEKTNRSLIQKTPFSPLTAAWRGDPERKELFAYLMLTLFRFVVLHEIGHFHHRHGVRFTASSGAMDVDSAQPKQLPEAEALDSQARELVADKFACETLVKIIEDEAKKLAAFPLTRTFAKQHLDTKVKRISFILQIAYIYFSATDRLPDADPVISTRMSHPPASFRLTTIVATSQTEFESENERKQINAFILVADAIMAVTLDRTPSITWLAQLDDPKFSDHYNNLYNRVDTWAVSPQKAPISTTNLL